MSKAIPKRLVDEFVGYMSVFDDDDMPDGAWFAYLELGGEQFIQKHKLQHCDGNDAAHQYIAYKADQQEKKS